MDQYKVTVVGGGVIGASCAYHLLESGVEDVLVLERDGPASKATGRSAGHINTYTSSKEDPDVHSYCLQFHQDLAARHDAVRHYQTTDYVVAHTDDGANELRSLYSDNTNLFRYLEPGELVEVAPVFDSSDTVAALEFEGALHTDPYSVTIALLEDVRTEGGTFRVEGVESITRGEKDFRIETDARTYATDIVVIAAGAWTPTLLSKLNESLPVAPRTSQAVVLDVEEGLEFPMFHMPDIGLYGRQEPNGDVLIGGGANTSISDPDDFSTNAREEFLQYVSETATTIPSKLEGAGLVNQWAGRCTATPDREPLIGETSITNCYVCTGFNGGGVERAPFAGRLLAELVTGQLSKFDADKVNPGRFPHDVEFAIKSGSTDW